MNNLQPEKDMDDLRFEDETLDFAWQKVESSFRSAGMVAPLPGFTNRWMQRLEQARQKQERRQAWALILTNLVIASGFILLIGLGFLPSVSGQGGAVNLWVGLMTKIIISVKMVGGLANTMLRTLPGVVPSSWWIAALTLLGIVVALWVSMVRRHFQNQGAQYE